MNLTAILNPTSVHSVSRQHSPGLDATIIEHPRLRELYVTLRPVPGEKLSLTLRRLERLLHEYEAVIVKQEIFGPIIAADGIMTMMRWLFGGIDWPVTWMEGGTCADGPICGMQLIAVSGVDVQSVYADDRVVASVFQDAHARSCFLGGILPRDTGASRDYQAGQVYEQVEIALAQVGMDLSHLVRTWLYLDDISTWYREFNEVRNEVYIQRRLLEGLVPASTGIGGRNPAYAALTAAAYAVQPRDEEISIQAVPSPLQCPAPTYGSCFSRAVAVTTPESELLMISGTASIEPHGRTAHIGNLSRQIDLTFRVVAAILESRHMWFEDVTRAVAYFKHSRDYPVFRAWWAEHGLSELPVIATRAEICREDLLFEIELDAIVSK